MKQDVINMTYPTFLGYWRPSVHSTLKCTPHSRQPGAIPPEDGRICTEKKRENQVDARGKGEEGDWELPIRP